MFERVSAPSQDISMTRHSVTGTHTHTRARAQIAADVTSEPPPPGQPAACGLKRPDAPHMNVYLASAPGAAGRRPELQRRRRVLRCADRWTDPASPPLGAHSLSGREVRGGWESPQGAAPTDTDSVDTQS